MTFWNGNAASPNNLRLFVPGEGWKNYSDQMTGDGQKVEIVGARRLIESAFLNALNATNVVVLTGTGSSFSARNGAGKLSPAGMWDIWNAAKAKVGDEVFAKVNQCFKDADVDNNSRPAGLHKRYRLFLTGHVRTWAINQDRSSSGD